MLGSQVPYEMDDLIDTRTAAEITGASPVTIRSWASRGFKIDGVKHCLEVGGYDERHRPVYRVIDVLKCARQTRRQAIGLTRVA